MNLENQDIKTETAIKTVERAQNKRRRASPWNYASRWFWRRMPKGLYARTLLIIIIPMLVLQSVLAFVFLERHWQTVTQRLSEAVTADIAAIIEIIEAYPQDEEFRQIAELAREKLSLNIAVLPPDPFPPPAGKPFFSVLDDALRSEITSQINRPFWIDTVGDSQLLEIRIRLQEPEKVLRVFAKRSRAYASNSHIFMVWMVGTSLFLLGIAVLLLRNQIRPILQLADAAESFGKGRDMPNDFRIRGATEVRTAGLAFLQMRERIERQIDQRTAMLTGVSHDLRTILTRFKLQLALLRETRETQDLQHDVDEMQKMLQGYLDFARGEGGEETETINLHGLLSRFEGEAVLREKEYFLDCDRKLTLKGRPNAIGRLFGNLISNAMRYADKTEVLVEHDDKWIHVDIHDNGPGIPAKNREDVFKPFLRLDEARNQNQSGTGLGLSIARDIARGHGGEITLDESHLGGVRATVRLPV